jgi:hypothetical protein
MNRNSATREIIEAGALKKNHEAPVMDTIQRLRKDAADRNTERQLNFNLWVTS